jgi:hypothetical protein
MRADGTRATEWPDAEYHARKNREAALVGKAALGGTNGPRNAGSAPEGLEMDFGDKENPALP